ncbi:MAG: DUF3999 domain-containing protein [Burkholderiales bacterium]|nr:DUF3999 domain-containing protein [Burkholderiales bacterium]
MKAVVLWVGLMVVPATAAGERIGDYGYAAPIEFTPGDALYSLRLPEAVYRHAVRTDLGDLRVFNGSGEAIPYALTQPPSVVRQVEAGIKLPQFPVRAASGSTTAEDLKVEVRRDGAVVSVHAAKGVAAGGVTAWLVDASGFEHPIEALDLAVDGGGDVVARIGVDASDDLKHWHRIAADAPVVRTRFGGERLEQLRVPLNGVRARYLRLADTRGAFSFGLAGVRAAQAAQADAPKLETLTLGAADTSANDRAWTYDTGGRFPVVRVALALPEENTVLPFALEARADPERLWHGLAMGVAYRLTQDSVAVSSAPLPVSTTERHLRVRLTAGAGPLPAAAPSLVAHWQPAELVFAARGSPPFTLAYGRANVEPMRVAIESIVPGYGTRTAMVPKPATAGAERILAGDAAAKAAPDYRRYSLWAVLGLGVLVLAGMGIKLARESVAR